MRGSFFSLLVGFWRHSWAFWIGFVLAVLDVAERLLPQWQLSALPSMIGWAVLIAGVLYAVWRAYDELWTQLPPKRRMAGGYLEYHAAAEELLRHWTDKDLSSYNKAPIHRKEGALQALEEMIEEDRVKIYEHISQERVLLIDRERYFKLKGINPLHFPDAVHFRKRDLKRAWRRYVAENEGKTIKQRFHRLLKAMARGKPASKTLAK